VIIDKVKIVETCQILQGSVIVTRNPCTHPGDVRFLQAVDIPELRYLENVIVFPSTGERPLCNMMAGGDLDGDVYFICWDETIISHLSEETM
jgi:RNA-dependent RNA polymerase